MSSGHQLAIGVRRNDVQWTSTRNSYGYGKYFIHYLGDLVKEIPGLTLRSSVNSDATTQFLPNALRLQSLMWLRAAVLSRTKFYTKMDEDRVGLLNLLNLREEVTKALRVQVIP